MSPYFVQIGLGMLAEFAELAKLGWHGALVDVDPLSFAAVYNNLKNDESYKSCFDRLSFYNMAVSEQTRIEQFRTYTFSRDTGTGQWLHTRSGQSPMGKDPLHATSFYSHSISLDEFLDTLPHVNLLAIDIEGTEDPMLRHYSFKHKPDCIQVEYHGTEHNVSIYLERAGYKRVRRWQVPAQPPNEKWLLKELHDSPALTTDIVGIMFRDQSGRSEFEDGWHKPI